MLVATGMLKQVGEDRVAHSRFSKTYISSNPQGKWFQIVYGRMSPSGLMRMLTTKMLGSTQGWFLTVTGRSISERTAIKNA